MSGRGIAVVWLTPPHTPYIPKLRERPENEHCHNKPQ